MNAEEILAAMCEAEGLYIELGDWVVAPGFDSEGNSYFCATRYVESKPNRHMLFSMLETAIEYALKDSKP